METADALGEFDGGHMGFSLAVVAHDGTVVSTNGVWRRIGESGARIARSGPGVNYLDICDHVTDASKPDAAAVAEAIRRVLAGRDDHASLAYCCEVPEVGPRWFEVRIDALGQVAPRSAVVIHQDVTERRREDVHAEARRRLLATLVDGISDVGIFMLDPMGRVQSWNTGAQMLLGYTREEILGKHFSVFFNERDRLAGVPQQHLDQAASDRLRSEGWRLDKCGEQHFVFSTLYALVDSRGTLLGFAKVVADASALQRAESELARAVVELQGRNKELEQFVYTVSHDLKTPLVTIAGFASHAREDLAHQRTDRLPLFVDRIAAASVRMGQTIDDLLRLSRLGRVVAPPQPINVPEVVGMIAAEIGELVASRAATIRIDPAIPTVYADPTRFRELIENLLTNALRYGCPDPGMEIRVTGTSLQTAAGARVHLSISDLGPGVPPEARERVFGLFQRLDSRGDGTGVGLTIVKRIAELHGGDAWVQATRPGTDQPGATFVVDLPGAPAGPREPSGAVPPEGESQ